MLRHRPFVLRTPLLILGVVTALAIGGSTAQAGFGTATTGPDNVDLATFLSKFETATTTPLISSFDFSPGTIGGDGVIVSQVFQDVVAPDATLLYAYLYQIQVSPGSSADVSLAEYNWKYSPFAAYLGLGYATPVGGGAVYEITTTGGAAPGAFTFTGLEESQDVSGADNSALTTVYSPGHPDEALPGDGQVNPGESSAIVVVFSTIAPGVLPLSTMADGPSGLLPPFPVAYVPGPEPASMGLFSMGLVGVGGMMLRRRSKKA